MAITFSGSPTVLDSLTYGNVNFPIVTGAANQYSIRTNIRSALAYGIKNNIKKGNGYFNDIGEVHVNAVASNSRRNNYPSIDIIWLRERYTNNIKGGNSLGGYNKIATVALLCYLFADACAPNNVGEIVLLRENIIADLEKYFGINFFIPDQAGNRTAFNCIINSNTVHGIQATEPYGPVEVELEIYYRIELADPTQDF